MPMTDLNKIEAMAFKVIDEISMSDIVNPKDNWRCPFCRSVHFYRSRKHYLCQDCDSCGDVISYTMNDKSCSMEEAVEKLYKRILRPADETP